MIFWCVTLPFRIQSFVPSDAQFQEVTGVRYPVLYEDFVAFQNVFNVNLEVILSATCAVDLDYYNILLYATLGPIVVYTMLAVVYVIAKRRNGHSQVALLIVTRKHLSVALFIAFAVYPSVSRIILKAFECEELDGVDYLKADYDLKCVTPEHKAYVAYASVMLLVYPVGIPTFFLWWLLRNKRIVQNGPSCPEDENKLKAFEGLWSPYKPRTFYYEIVEYVRRLTLTGLPVFVWPGSAKQIAVIIVLVMLFWIFSEMISPFRRRVDAWLYRGGAFTEFLSMYVALLVKIDMLSEDSTRNDGISSALIAGHVVLVLIVVSQSFISLRKEAIERIVELKVPRRRGSS